MKKTAAFILAALLAFSLTACGGDHQEKKESVVSSEVSVTESQEEENSIKETDLLLMRTFGELWLSDYYYIDVNMKVEYDADTVDDSSGETSAGLRTVNYSYIVAEDRLKGIAGLSMISDTGSQSSLVKDNYIYTINHTDKTYTKKLYAGTADDFGQSFTTGVCLGMVNKCKLENTGKTTYKDQEVTFEKYAVILGSAATESSSSMTDNTNVTYYFDSKGNPVAEIFRTGSGTTTFEFNRISKLIEVQSILEIPEGYTEVAEESKSES